MRLSSVEKTLKKIRQEAEKTLKSSKSTLKEKKQAQLILAMDTSLIMLKAQRDFWLSSFTESKDLNKHLLKKRKEEDDFINKVLVIKSKLKI